MRPIWIFLTGIFLVVNIAGAALAEGAPVINLLAQAPVSNILNQDETADNQPTASGPSDTVRLSDLITLAFNNNPSITIARSNWQAAVDEYPQATSWPDPSADFKWFLDSGNYEAQLMQMIPNPRQTSIKGSLALSWSEIARLNYEKTVRDVIVDVMRSYYELGYLERAAQIARENNELFAQVVEVANLDYAQGAIGASEKAVAESRLAQSSYELLLLQEQLYTEQANMRSLLGVSPEDHIGTADLPSADPVDLDLEQIRTQTRENRLELLMAGISVDTASDNVSLAQALASPDFSLGVMYESMAGAPMGIDEMGDPLPSSRENNVALMFGITIPIWGGKNSSRIAQAEAQLDAVEADQARQVNQAMASADRIYYQIQNLSRLIELYQGTLIPQASQAVNLAQTWYESGESSFNDLIESRLVLGDFQLAGARAQADYLIALAELQRLTGVPVGNTETPVEEAPEVAQ